MSFLARHASSTTRASGSRQYFRAACPLAPFRLVAPGVRTSWLL